MNRLLIAIVVLGFLALGLEAKTRSERNQRAKDVTATINKGIDLGRTLLKRDYEAANDYINIPPSWRQKNWSTARGGSCVYATAISLLRWQGKDREAEEIKRTCGGGSNAETVGRKMKALGLKVVWSNDADKRLIDWALKTRRGCGVGYHGHCTALVGRANGLAYILDNNRVDKIKTQPWERFERDLGSRGDVFAIVATPPPPTPKLKHLLLGELPCATVSLLSPSL